MHKLTDELTQWQAFIRSWFCNSAANRHDIWVRLRKRLKFEVWTISSESAKCHRMKLTMIQTWFKKSYTHRLSTPEDKGLIQKVNIFGMGNGHVHAFNTPTKNRANWMRASYLFSRLKKIGHYFCRRVYVWLYFPVIQYWIILFISSRFPWLLLWHPINHTPSKAYLSNMGKFGAMGTVIIRARIQSETQMFINFTL